MSAINIILDGPPDHLAGRFVEVETDDGRSISVGQWFERPDGYWSLRIEMPELPLTLDEVRRIVFFLNQRTDEREALVLAEKINVTMGAHARRHLEGGDRDVQ